MKYVVVFLVLLKLFFDAFISQSVLPGVTLNSDVDDAPVFIRVAFSFGDKYAAGNLGAFELTWLNYDATSNEDMKIVSGAFDKVSFLNPASEDIYYYSQAILPWAGYKATEGRILKRASLYRSDDWLPDFYLGFNSWYFERDYKESSYFIGVAEKKAKYEQDKLSLHLIKQKWEEHSHDTKSAYIFVKAMADGEKNPMLKKYYYARAERLSALSKIEDASVCFKGKNKFHKLVSFDQLISYGCIKNIPDDPFQIGWGIDSDGNPYALGRKKK